MICATLLCEQSHADLNAVSGVGVPERLRLVEQLTSQHALFMQAMLPQSGAPATDNEDSGKSFTSAQLALLRSLCSFVRSVSQRWSLHVPQLASMPSQMSQLMTEIDTLQKWAGDPEKASGNFEWIDGVLIQALQQGAWLLMDNVNFCPASVLDRLNALLEPNGVLLVNECGLVDGQPRVIVPHPNFRLFMTMDPTYGEVSRAMRNRCVELALPLPLGHVTSLPASLPSSDVSTAAEQSARDKVSDVVSKVFDSQQQTEHLITRALLTTNGLFDREKRDLITLVSQVGLPGYALPSFLVSVHCALLKLLLQAHRTEAQVAREITSRNLLSWARLIKQVVSRGATALAISSVVDLSSRQRMGSAELIDAVVTALFASRDDKSSARGQWSRDPLWRVISTCFHQAYISVTSMEGSPHGVQAAVSRWQRLAAHHAAPQARDGDRGSASASHVPSAATVDTSHLPLPMRVWHLIGDMFLLARSSFADGDYLDNSRSVNSAAGAFSAAAVAQHALLAPGLWPFACGFGEHLTRVSGTQ